MGGGSIDKIINMTQPTQQPTQTTPAMEMTTDNLTVALDRVNLNNNKDETVSIENTRVKDFTLENATQPLLDQAREIFTEAEHSLAEFRKSVQVATNQPDRKAARTALKSKREEVQGKMNNKRKSCRNILDAIPKTDKSQRMSAKENLIVARLALQLLKQAPVLVVAANQKKIEEKALKREAKRDQKQKQQQHQQEQGPVAGLCVKDITLENAPTEMVTQATIAFKDAISTLKPLVLACQSAETKPAKQAFRQQFQAKRKELQDQLDSSRIEARNQFKLASEPATKATAKANLVVARLAQQMFNKERMFANLPRTNTSTEASSNSNTNSANTNTLTSSTSNTKANTNARTVPRVTLKDASDEVKEQAATLLNDFTVVVNADTSSSTITTVREQLEQRRKLCRQTFNTANKHHDNAEELQQATDNLIVAQLATQLLNKASRQEQQDEIDSVTIDNAPAPLLIAASETFDHLKQTLQPLLEVVEAADKTTRRSTRQALQQSRKQMMVSLHEQRKTTRKAFDSVPKENVEEKNVAKDQLLITRLTIAMVQRFNNSSNNNNTTTNTTNNKPSFGITMKDVHAITEETASAELLAVATQNFSAIKQELQALRVAVHTAAKQAQQQQQQQPKAVARQTLQHRRRQLMASLHDQRKSARQAFEAAEDKDEKTIAMNELVIARLTLNMIATHNTLLSHVNLKEINTITFDNADTEVRDVATEMVTALRHELEALDAAVVEGATNDKHTDNNNQHTARTARKALQARRKEITLAFNKQRDAARVAFEVAESVETKTAAKQHLIATRLAIEMLKAFETTSRPTKKPKTETNKPDVEDEGGVEVVVEVGVEEGVGEEVETNMDFNEQQQEEQQQQQQQVEQQQQQQQQQQQSTDQAGDVSMNVCLELAPTVDEEQEAFVVVDTPSSAPTPITTDIDTTTDTDIAVTTTTADREVDSGSVRVHEFDEQLQTLANMGFHDEGLLVPLLMQNQGSVLAIIATILPE